MTEREKVIKGLEDSFINQGFGYMDGVGELYAVSGEDLQNAIALLKEQREIVRCKDCRYWKSEVDNTTHWICTQHSFNGRTMQTTPDWFCADGKRR